MSPKPAKPAGGGGAEYKDIFRQGYEKRKLPFPRGKGPFREAKRDTPPHPEKSPPGKRGRAGLEGLSLGQLLATSSPGWP